MRFIKRALCALAVIGVFLLVTAGFLRLFQTHWLPEQKAQTLLYTQPVTVPTETPAEQTQPTAAETEPPETTPPETEPVQERFRYDAVPVYDQTAYPDVRYQYGTLATDGSNITCLAMAASYLTGHEYRPDTLARDFATYIGNSMQWLEYVSDRLQLPWHKAANIDEVIASLWEGKIAVVLMNENSVFGEGWHYVVFTGITPEGKILVNDPYGPNYTVWHLTGPLAEGFEKGSLSGSYSGGWIYDPAAMPEMPFLYEPEENTDIFRYGDLQLSQEDRDLIAKLVCMEGESEPFEGQQGIAEVILNRMAAGNFPDTAKGVIYAEGQFLSANQLYLAQPTHVQYEAVERALNGPYVLEGDVVFFSKYAVNDNIWGTIGQHIFCRQW